MIGIEILGIACPRCGVKTMGSSAKAGVVKQVIGKELNVPDNEVICYSVCPICMGMIFPQSIIEKENSEKGG